MKVSRITISVDVDDKQADIVFIRKEKIDGLLAEDSISAGQFFRGVCEYVAKGDEPPPPPKTPA